MSKRPWLFGAIVFILSAPVAGVRAQDYSIDWYKIAGGGGVSGGDNYSVNGSVGQPDAGAMSGGTFTLEGGFWPGIIVASDGGAPTLLIQQAGGNVTISWLPATQGFRLEETTDLTSPTWVPAPGANPTATIPTSGVAKYYRLRKP